MTTSFSAFPPSQQAIRARCVHPTGRWVELTTQDIGRSIPAYFEEQVTRHAQRVAVKSTTQQMTYAELNSAANAIAHAVLDRITPDSRPLALYLEPEAIQIAAMLGALKSGNAYVALNPRDPPARNRHILRDLQPGLILAETKTLAAMADLAPDGLPTLDIDPIDRRLDPGNPGLSIAADAAARIGYTTGSTGMAKGIVFTHGHLLHHTALHVNAMHICAEDRILRSGATDLNTVLQALLCGARVLLYDFIGEGVHELAPWLIQEEATMMRMVPSILRRMAPTTPRDDRFPTVRVISLMGDTVHKQDVELYQQHFSPDCILLNCLGCQETQDYRIFYMDYATRLEGSIVPAGYALPDKESSLVDEAGQPVGPGEVGEIAVRSRFISPGYVGRPSLTASKFLPDPDGGNRRIYLTGDLGQCAPDGCLFHLGRKDFQVKIRGKRVETNEVEDLLRSLATVKEAAVGVHLDPAGEARLVAYVVPAGIPAPTASALRQHLAAALPDHMVPSAFVMLETLPRTHNGKIDRKALLPPSNSRPSLDNPFVAPSTPMERAIADIWAEVLGVDAVGIHDNFLDLGGHSLLATQIMARLLQALRVELPLQQLLQSPTVAEMAAVILVGQARRLAPAELDLLLAQIGAGADS